MRSICIIVVALAVCQRRPPPPPADPAPGAILPAPKVPREGDAFSPSLAALEGPARPETLHSFTSCARCHAAIVQEWKESAHSLASLTNPLYQRSFSDFVQVRGEEKTRFCAGCHDPALLFDPLAKLATDPTQPGAHVGIGCAVCHGAVAARPAGNGAYTLTTSEIPLPKGDPASLDAHLARVANTTLRTNTLCISCHRGALTPAMGHAVALLGLDEWGPWRRSVYAGNQTRRMDEEGGERKGCTDCHMPMVAGHRSHRFAGGHSTLAGMIHSPAQLAATRAMLEGAASVDVFPLPALPKGVMPPAGAALAFDVVIFNERVGHNFPGGAKDLRDTWLEVKLEDAAGRVLAASGVAHETTGREPYAYVLHTRVANEAGVAQAKHEVAHFRTPVYDHTIAPRDAAVVRYAVSLPPAAQGPFTVAVRLRHRRLTSSSFEAGCQVFRSDAGQAYARRLRQLKGLSLDGCAPQPLIDVASARVALESQGPAPALGVGAWRRAYRYGLGLLHARQEDLDEARLAFGQALSALGDGGPARLRAMALEGLAEVAALQSRRDEALKLLAEAGRLVPDAPSLSYGAGEAHLAAWRFAEAALAFETAAAQQDDDRSWRHLATALGSIGRPRESLLAAQRGLALEGRDALLLRNQLLAYRKLAAPQEWVSQASRALQTYERDVEAPHVRDRCAQNDPVCRVERTPLAVRWLGSYPPPQNTRVSSASR